MPPENKEVSLSDLADMLHQVQAQLKTVSDEVGRLGKLADQAEKFLHNPIGAYKAARGKLTPRG